MSREIRERREGREEKGINKAHAYVKREERKVRGERGEGSVSPFIKKGEQV